MTRNTIDPEDKRNIRLIRQGEPDAFRHFLDKYGPSVERLVARHLPMQNVPEVAQDAFVQAYGSLDSFDEDRPFGSWMSTIALRCCYDRLRKVYANREFNAADLGTESMDWLDRAAQEGAAMEMTDQERWEAREVLDQALEQIEPRDRMVLELTVVEGHSAAEAAELLDMSAINVRVRAFRAKKRLRDILAGLMDEE